MVGFVTLDQTTPFWVTVPIPAELTFPFNIAVVAVIAVASLVVTIGKLLIVVKEISLP